MRLTLRPYQSTAIDNVIRAEAKGTRRQLGVAGTGMGKTVIFASLAERLKGRCLVLVHRDELVNQAVGKMVEIWPELTATPSAKAALAAAEHPMADTVPTGAGVGIVKAGADDVAAHVVVASIQTLARPARIGRLMAAMNPSSALLDGVPPFRLVIVDEAHHAAAETYRFVLRELAAGEAHGPLLLGVTATPDRGDGVGLDDVFQQVVFDYPMLWGIQAGYLADVHGRAIKVEGFDVDDIKTTGGKGGDYQAGDAGRHMQDAGAPQIMAKAMRRHAKDLKTLVFTPTVAMAEAVAAECVGLGDTAAWVSGETPVDDRRRILGDFRDGRIQRLVNCAVLTEGYDDPGIQCVMVGRPTKSRALYAQMIGRGTRKHPEKDHLLVLDVVGATAEHSLVTVPSLFGLGGKLRKRAENATAGVAELVAEHQAEQVRVGEIKAEEVELFRQVRATNIAWIQVHSSGAPRKKYVRPMPQPGPHDRNQEEIPSVCLFQRVPNADVWGAGLQWRGGAQRVLIDRVPLETATGVGEDAVRKMSSSSALVTTDAAWRQKAPSAALVRAAGKWRVKITDGQTAGDVSDAINHKAEMAQEWKRRKARENANT